MTQEATKTEETLKSDAVELVVKRNPACVVEFEVKTTKELAEKAQKKAIRAVSKEVSLPGFRKGKAPEDIILKRYGAAVDERWQKEIADSAFVEAEKLANIPLLNTKTPITFNMHKHSLDAGAEMTFSFETEPEIPAVDMEKLTLPKLPKEEITDEKIAEGVRQVSFFFADWTTVEDRGAQSGDYLILDIYSMEGEAPHKVFNDTRFELTEKSMSQWMRELTLGMKTGESKEGVSKPDDDASEEEKKEFEPKKVKVEVKKIETAKLPTVDDAFAAKVGCKTADELKTNIRGLFEKNQKEKNQKLLRDHIADELVKIHTFDLPKSILDDEFKFRLQHSLQHPQFKKEWEQKSDEEKKDYENKVREQAESAVRLFYICRKIANDANIAISPEEVNPTEPSFLELLLGMRSPYEQPPSKDEQAVAMSRLLLRKAEDHIIAQLEKKNS